MNPSKGENTPVAMSSKSQICLSFSVISVRSKEISFKRALLSLSTNKFASAEPHDPPPATATLSIILSFAILNCHFYYIN
jgi:hypothetical protein